MSGASNRVPEARQTTDNSMTTFLQRVKRKALDRVAGRRDAGVNVSIYNLPKRVLPRSVWPHALQSISDWKTALSTNAIGVTRRTVAAASLRPGVPGSVAVPLVHKS